MKTPSGKKGVAIAISILFFVNIFSFPVNASDTTPPEITDVFDTPDPQDVGGYVNITCNVTDDVVVDEVWVNITYPDNSYHNQSMVGGRLGIEDFTTFEELDPNCSDDRFLVTRTQIKPHTSGRDILICPPSQKAMKFWGLDVDEWINNTVDTIKQNSDRPIVIRKKGTRAERTTVDTMEMALGRDVHCMVTFNSIAAVESLIYGKPVFTMGPNAAQPLANTDLTQIDNPYMPSFDAVRNLCCNLAYQQFTVAEMRSGKAWAMLNAKV